MKIEIKIKREEYTTMKFEVISKEFKNAVDRVMAVVMSKSPIKGLSSIRIVSGNNCIIIGGTNINEFVDITVPAEIIEDGEIYVDAADIVKVYGLSSYITVEAQDGIFTVKNEKKCCEVQGHDYGESMPKKPEFTDNAVLKFKERELLFALSKLKCFTAGSEFTRQLLTGFNINSKSGYITACDSCRLGMRKLNAETYNNDLNITVPNFVHKSLKKIGNAKSDEDVFVYIQTSKDNKVKNVCFKGKDYTYASKVLNGDYINIKNVVNISPDYQFKMSSEEIGNIAKEYSKVDKETDLPLCLIKYNNKMYSSIISSNYQTADMIETVKEIEDVPEDMVFFVTPSFLADAMSLFDGEDVEVYGQIRISGTRKCYTSEIFFENEDFKCMILPQAANIGIVDNMKKIIDKI